MKQRSLLILILIFAFITHNQIFAQNKVYPTVIKKPVGFEITKPLKDNPVITGFEKQYEEFYMNKHRDRIIDPSITPPDFKSMPVDPNVQKEQGRIKNSKGLLKNYVGQNSSSYPPDCNGTAGPNHYFQVVNLTYAIYNKSDGVKVAGPSALNSIFNSTLPGAGYNDGDPIVLWDEQADRWFYSEFSLGGANDYMLIAVSTTNDPTGTWYSWSFDVDDTPDYMKFGIWQDGYYMSTNTSNGNDVYVFERSKMIAGDPNPQMIAFDNPNRPSTFDGFHCIQPLDNDGLWAPAGTPGQFITIADNGQNNPSDALYIYELNADWITPSNSTFVRTQTINVNSFSGNFTSDWKNIPQPGTTQKLDAISTVLMYRAQYRNFSGTQKIVCTHTIAETSTESAIRWYELENTGSGWSIAQQGTYNPDNISRWNASIAMNDLGQIGMGYAVSNGTSTYPGIRYCGQTSNAPSGVMDVAETVIKTGQYSQTAAERWGDYSNISVDPSDGKTFWYTSEYMGSSTHGTQIAAFTIDEASCTPPSSQASNFSANSIGDNTMTISWTRGSGNSVMLVAHEASVVNADPVSGTSYTSNSVFGSGSQIGTGNYVLYRGTGSSVSISGLTQGTTYYFAVYEYNTADNCYNTTELSGNATTTGVSYCASAGNSVADEWINRVTIGTIDNTSGANGGYADFTSMSFDIAEGTPETITIYPAWGGQTYSEGYAVWIDINQDGDFNDTNELVFSNAASQSTSVSGTITIPSGTILGNTRMRVSMKYNAIPTQCEAFSYGEVEDYTVNIINAGDTQAPTAPSNLSSSSVTSNSLTISWTASTDNVAVTGYEVFKDGTSLGTVTGTSASVTGLTPETQYSFYVKAYDAAGNKSNASNTISVTTAVEADTQAPTAPSSLAFANVTQISVDLSWTASTDNVGVTGYKIYKDGTLLTSVTGTSYTVNGLSAATTYQFYVIATDAAGNTSSQSNTVSVTTQSGGISYCTSKGNSVADEWIDRVICGDIDNNSGANAGYGDFTYLSTPLYKGNSASITITPAWSGTVYSEGYSVWIDYNQDGDFADAGEQVFSLAATKDTPINGSFTVSASAINGETRMRISMKYNGIPTSCEAFSYGEVEDYTVNIQDGGDLQAPTAPANLTSSNITQTSVLLSWTAATDNVGVTGYDIYKDGVFLINTTGTSYTVNSLTASTSYSFYVKAKDAAGNVSTASNTVNITTLSVPDTQAPTAPASLTTSNITSTSLNLNWTASTDDVGVAGYYIYQGGTNIASTANLSYTVSGLSPSTSYSFYIKAYDAAGNISAASNTVNPTTTAGATYCASKGNSVADEWIQKVVCGSINNNSGANGGYADFTSMSTNINIGVSQSITITPGWAGTVYSEGYSVWIDYNQDGDFADAGEQVFSLAATKNTPVSGSFTVPSGTITGNTRMRVSMKYNAIPTACEAFSYGEVEDYTVNIISSGADTQAPTAPTSLAASNITQTTVDLSWSASTDNVGVSNYNVYKDGALLGTVTGTSAQVTGLTAGTSYSFYVTAEDAAGNVSGQSNTINITTSPATVTYCTSKGNNVSDEWIQRVVCGSIDNNSGVNAGYADFTAMSTNMTRNSIYSITIYPTWSATVYSEGYSVWIDYNQDGDFDDAGEQVFTNAKTTATSVNGSFTIPASATIGSTRMRVSMQYNTIPLPCGNFDYGEVEDYTIVIGAKSYTTEKNNLYIYPNPAQNIITVYLKNMNENSIVQIYSITGSLIKEVQISEYNNQINISDLPNGIYNLRLIQNNKLVTGRFIKQ
ncbi:MAG: GEVED domain-containing protein [Bacteroidales bacterium]|nr:GEVED domain-containing protein [Bacteroidales bacterium]